MADDKTPSPKTTGTDALSGFPDDPGAPPPGASASNASTEPEAQLVSRSMATDFTSDATGDADASSMGSGSVDSGASSYGASSYGSAAADDSLLPPPASYEMPDEYATSWLDRTRDWVEKNPALAVAAAAGVGLVVGRLVIGALPDPEPDTLGRRARRGAKRLEKASKGRFKSARKGAAHFADDTGDVLQHRLAKAAEALSDAAEAAAEKAGGGVEKATDLAETIGDAVKAAVVGAVNRGADSWVGKLRR